MENKELIEFIDHEIGLHEKVRFTSALGSEISNKARDKIEILRKIRARITPYSFSFNWGDFLDTTGELNEEMCEPINDLKGEIKDLKEEDLVNSPLHYQLDGMDIEVIDIIRSVLSEEEFSGYCLGNIIKYILRADKKGGITDIKKARKYMDFMEEQE